MSHGRPFGRLLLAAASLLLITSQARAGDPFPQVSAAERALIAGARAAVQASCECTPTATRGAYMRCVSHAVKAQVAAGRLSKKQMHMVMKCADRSTCGRPGKVTCCKTSRRGRTKCAVVQASKCQPRRGGTACETAFASWCDAVERGCSPAQVEQDTQCCIPPDPTSPGGAFTCELLKPAECDRERGVLVGDGTCEPDPCADVTTTTTTTTSSTSSTGPTTTVTVTTTTTLPLLTQCCVASSPGGALDECQQLTAAECAEAGGQDAGPGSCDPNPCPVVSTTTTTISTTTTTTNPCGNGRLDPGEECDPPWSRNPEQCPPAPGRRFGPECGDDCRCLTTSTTAPTTTTTGATTSTTSTTIATTTTTEATTSSTTSTTEATTTTTEATTSSTTTTTEATTTTTEPTTTSSTTSTTVTTSSTTTTTGPRTLQFTTTVGSANCGPAGLTANGAAPFSGELTTDTACSANLRNLGLGCLYFGGGNGTVVPPGKIPDNATSIFDVTGEEPIVTLAASDGTSRNDCTKGAGPGRHCVNNNAMPACTTDANCGGAAGSCALEANCFFGPPLPILSPPPFGSLTTCVLNVIQSDGSGTANTTDGSSTASLPLSSRVYITGNTGSPCPRCPAGSCTYGQRAGMSCSPVGSLQTTNDCHPSLGGFQAPLAVTLSPLSTGTVTDTAADGLFCPGQTNAGAFGQSSVQCIEETGTPSGPLSPNTPAPAVLASVFCIPPTNNVAVDGVADLPGPGAIGLNGTVVVNF